MWRLSSGRDGRRFDGKRGNSGRKEEEVSERVGPDPFTPVHGWTGNATLNPAELHKPRKVRSVPFPLNKIAGWNWLEIRPFPPDAGFGA
jgi:hypothetical protein